MKILYFLSFNDFGIGPLLTNKVIALNHCKKNDYLFITGTTEKQSGLFDKLKDNNIPYKTVLDIEYHRNFLSQLRDLKRIISSFIPDVIHVQTNWQLVLIILIKLLSFGKFKIFYTVHGFRNNSPYKALLFKLILGTIFFLFVRKIIVCSSFVEKHFAFLSYKIDILYLGIDPIFYEKSDNSDLDTSGKLNLCYPAVFRNGKKHEFLIYTIAKFLKESNWKSDIYLYLPGFGENQKKCIELVKDLGFENNIIFPGHLNDKELVSLMRKCSIAIIPSVSETFGSCIAEPFAYGRCVISRTVGVAPDIIINGENGFLFHNDVELYGILENILNNPEIILNCGNNAFKNRELFKWEYIAQKYEALLENI